MKKLFLEKSIIFIKKYNNYDSDQIDKIKYGLEGLYITLSKTIIIFLIGFILNIWKELLLLVLFFNFLRLVGFGLHAKSSGICLVFSTAIFIGSAYISKFLIIPLWIRLIISLVCILGFAIWAPADTEKRPLINKKKRLKYKLMTLFVSIIYLIAHIFIKNDCVLNLINISMIIEFVLVNPLSYKILGLRYDNYKYYKG